MTHQHSHSHWSDGFNVVHGVALFIAMLNDRLGILVYLCLATLFNEHELTATP